MLSGYQDAGNCGGVWTIALFAMMSSIILYAVTIVEAAVLSKWGPNAEKT